MEGRLVVEDGASGRRVIGEDMAMATMGFVELV